MSEDASSIGWQQARHRADEVCGALRALLMTPLMTPAHGEFAAARRHADELRVWFARETGWTLQIERDCARLYKRPADLAHLADATRGLPGYGRRRYVLLCLACAVLERADPQITLRVLGERLLSLATDPALAARDFTFTLQAQHERRELVAVCRSLLELGVLQRVAGDEEGFVRSEAENSDALYDIQRRVLAGMLAAVRGPSTWSADDAPFTFEARLHSLVDEPRTDSEEARRNAQRHRLSRRLLDDPVVYADALDAETRAYFANQRGPMAARLCAAAGLRAEQRAEGLALVDEDGALTDIAMPAEGTDAHVTLLVAELLASAYRNSQTQAPAATPATPTTPTTQTQISAYLRRARERFGGHWRKSAREPGSEHELAAGALERLHKLQLIERSGDEVRPLPALARFAVGAPRIKKALSAAPRDLFDSPSIPPSP
jgi:uncharacterized protein (TIGR02678 family)